MLRRQRVVRSHEAARFVTPAGRRPAPDSEWVLMYRQGIPARKIAAVAGAAETTVRYHIAIAAKQDPSLSGRP